jgi:hypothetical protein
VRTSLSTTPSKKEMATYLPVLVMIISVPRSWNLSQRSLVSKWHSTLSNSSQLQDIFVLGLGFSGTMSGDSRSKSVGSEPQSEIAGDCRSNFGLMGLADSLSEHSSTSTSTSSSSKGSSMSGELDLEIAPRNFTQIKSQITSN